MEKLVLTANQIYTIAYIMKAHSIDAFYINRVDRPANDQLWLSENTKQLVSQGMLVEDFSGELNIDSDIENLLKPLFFSEKESSLEIITVGDNENNLTYRFHYSDTGIVMTKTVDGKFEMAYVASDDINHIVESILPSSYEAESTEVSIDFIKEKVSRFIIAKNINMGDGNQTSVFVEYDGLVYEGDTDNKLFTVSRKDFIKKITLILSEVG